MNNKVHLRDGKSHGIHAVANQTLVLSWGGEGVPSGGSSGALPPPAQNFFIFMQFLGKIGQIIGWRLLG